jgi:hypothetical protein
MAQIRAREKNLAWYTSIASGTVANLAMLVFSAAGVPISSASAVTTLFANLLGYSLDVMFAKRAFGDLSGRGGPDALLESVREKALWLAQSLASYTFVRFLITVSIEIIITTFLLRYFTAALDDAGILKEWRWRDTVLSAAIAAVLFGLFVNRIRFDWAYVMPPDPSMDILMMIWFSTLVVSHIVYEKVRKEAEACPCPDRAEGKRLTPSGPGKGQSGAPSKDKAPERPGQEPDGRAEADAPLQASYP